MEQCIRGVGTRQDPI